MKRGNAVSRSAPFGLQAQDLLIRGRGMTSFSQAPVPEASRHPSFSVHWNCNPTSRTGDMHVRHQQKHDHHRFATECGWWPTQPWLLLQRNPA